MYAATIFFLVRKNPWLN